VYLAVHAPASFWDLVPRLFGLRAAPWLSAVVLVSLAVALNTWFLAWVPNHTLALAMSWDRLLPRWMSGLDTRRGTPVRAIVAFSVGAAAVLLLYAKASVWQLVLHATLVSLVTFAVTCLAAALFPFRRRELYRESTAAPYELLRVPLITVAGLVFVAFSAYLGNHYLAFGSLSGEVRPTGSLTFVAVVYGAATAMHVVFRRHRRGREGAGAEIYYREADGS